MGENFMTGAMQGYAFVRGQQRTDDELAQKKEQLDLSNQRLAKQDARADVVQGRQDEEYANKLDLRKIEAVRYAIGTTRPGEDPTANLTAEQLELVQKDPGVMALLSSPELRKQRAQNLALIDEGFEEYQAKLAAPPQSNLEVQRTAGAAEAKPNPLKKMIQGAQGEWGAQLQKGKDQFGSDINEIAKQYPDLKAPDGTPVGTKVIHSLHPSADGKALAFELKVTTVDPKTGEVVQYTAPATEGRDGNPESPVLFRPISQITQDLHMRERLLAFADARAVELGSDGPIKQQQATELASAKSKSEMALKAYEAKMTLAKIEFEQGKISENKMKQIEAQGKLDLEKEGVKFENDKTLAHIKGGYDIKGREVTAAGKKTADGVKEMTKGQAATVAERLLRRKRTLQENDEGDLDPDEQLLLDVALKHSTGKEPGKSSDPFAGSGVTMPIPPRGKQPQAIGGSTPIAANPTPAKVPTPAAPATATKPAAPKPASAPAKAKVDLNKFFK